MLTAPIKVITNKYFRKFDNLDKERIWYMRAAENFAGSPPPNGVYEWSPLLEQTVRAITYWKLRLQLFCSNTHTSDRLHRLVRKLSVDDSGLRDIQYVEGKLKCAWQAPRRVQKLAVKNRESRIESLAKHFAVKRNTARCIEVNKIRHLNVPG